MNACKLQWSKASKFMIKIHSELFTYFVSHFSLRYFFLPVKSDFAMTIKNVRSWGSYSERLLQIIAAKGCSTSCWIMVFSKFFTVLYTDLAFSYDCKIQWSQFWNVLLLLQIDKGTYMLMQSVQYRIKLLRESHSLGETMCLHACIISPFVCVQGQGLNKQRTERWSECDWTWDDDNCFHYCQCSKP